MKIYFFEIRSDLSAPRLRSVGQCGCQSSQVDANAINRMLIMSLFFTLIIAKDNGTLPKSI